MPRITVEISPLRNATHFPFHDYPTRVMPPFSRGANSRGFPSGERKESPRAVRSSRSLFQPFPPCAFEFRTRDRGRAIGRPSPDATSPRRETRWFSNAGGWTGRDRREIIRGGGERIGRPPRAKGREFRCGSAAPGRGVTATGPSGISCGGPTATAAWHDAAQRRP